MNCLIGTYGHYDIDQIGLIYEIIDKDKLGWLRSEHERQKKKIEELTKQIRVYKRNEKY